MLPLALDHVCRAANIAALGNSTLQDVREHVKEMARPAPPRRGTPDRLVFAEAEMARPDPPRRGTPDLLVIAEAEMARPERFELPTY
jgi:hypothetical protein